MAGGPVFGRQDDLADGALARPRQGRLDEPRRRLLAHGAWPTCLAPGSSHAQAGARDAWRGSSRARWPAPVEGRAAAPAIHALQLPARFQPLALRSPVGLAAMEEAACAPSRLLRVGATRHAKPGRRRRHSSSRRSGPVAMPRPASSTQAARPCRGRSNQALRAKGGDDARRRCRRRPLTPSRTAWRTPFGRGFRKRRGECATRHRAAIRKCAVRLAQRQHDGLG